MPVSFDNDYSCSNFEAVIFRVIESINVSNLGNLILFFRTTSQTVFLKG